MIMDNAKNTETGGILAYKGQQEVKLLRELKTPIIAMFTMPCRGEAFAVIGTNTSIPKRANASPNILR